MFLVDKLPRDAAGTADDTPGNRKVTVFFSIAGKISFGKFIYTQVLRSSYEAL